MNCSEYVNSKIQIAILDKNNNNSEETQGKKQKDKSLTCFMLSPGNYTQKWNYNKLYA